MWANMKHMDNYYDQILYPITHPQKRIWYIDTIYAATSICNIGGYVKIRGSVDLKILEASIFAFIQNNDSVRLRIVEQDGEVQQYVGRFEDKRLDYFDFIDRSNPIEEFNKWIGQEAGKPFSIEEEYLFYFALYRLSDNECGYLVKFHHIIADGWSTNIMTQQICDFYRKIANGEKVGISSSYSYIGYIESEMKYLCSDRFLKNKRFWLEKFSSLPDRSFEKNSNSIEGKRKTYNLDCELSLKIKEFSKASGYSVNTFFVTLYLHYVYKTTLKDDIVIGLPSYNRSGFKEKNTFGMFTSTIPFRFMLDSSMNLFETMDKVNKGLGECYFNQKYPYDLLVKDLELKKKGYDNLFSTCINYYNTKLNTELNGNPIENVEFYNGNQVYSLQIIIRDWLDSGSLALDFDYKVSDFTEYQIANMYNSFIRMITQLIQNPLERIETLSLLSDDERKRKIFEFNNTKACYPKDKMIHQLIEEQVMRTPYKIAACYEGTEITYIQLNEKANQLARYLIKNGVRREDLIGLLTTHSLENLIGILAILKAGGAYVPIDINYPIDRVNYILEDAQCKILLTNIVLSDRICFNGKIISLYNQDIYSMSCENVETVNQQNDMVYLIYTSGSTGKPKGSIIEHRGLVNYILWAKKMYIKSSDEVFPLYSSLAFDLTVTSIFTPLISGSKIIIYSDHNSEEFVLYRIVKDNMATVIKLTPAHLVLLKDQDNNNSSIRRFIVGGEDLKVQLAKAIYDSFHGRIEIFNEYGPTETVVGCMIHKYDVERDTDSSVPIGIPADNVQIYLLDPDLNPVGENMIGEIYVSGDGVSRGYLGKKELTQEKFINNPFIPGTRMYRTNDLARYLENGEIEYVGRADFQVKINGFRIEPGEIENVLLGHAAIKNVVVIDDTDENSGKYICAYVVMNYEVDTNDLKEFLKKRVPDYMIPAFFIKLDEIPLTLNGKVNREALPKPTIHSTEFKGYSTSNEEVLTKVICKVLMLERVSVTHNFYYLGGDSVKAIQISSKLRDKGYRIKVKDILENPVIEQMARCLELIDGSHRNQMACTGSMKETPIVSWFLSKSWADPNHYNQSIILNLKKNVESKAIEYAFDLLIKHHDSLRININLSSRELFYNSGHLDKQIHIEEYDLSGLSHTQQVEQIEKISAKLKAGFHIETDLLIKACVFRLSSNDRQLLITAHHLVIDGISWRILLEDLNNIFGKLHYNQEVLLPLKTCSYQEWSETLTNHIKLQVEQEKSYWKDVISHYNNFLTDFDLGIDTLYFCSILESGINEEYTSLLMMDANIAYNTQTKDLLIASLARTIKLFTANSDIILELEGHGRETSLDTIDTTRTVGWFTSIFPFYVNLKDDDISNQIIQVKAALRKVPNNGIGYGILNYISKDIVQKDINQKNQSYIRFNYLGDFDQEFDNEYFEYNIQQFKNDVSIDNSMTALIEVNCFIKDRRLQVKLSYSRNKYREETMLQLQDKLISSIETIITHCCNKKTKEFSPYDFDLLDISQEELNSLFD